MNSVAANVKHALRQLNRGAHHFYNICTVTVFCPPDSLDSKVVSRQHGEDRKSGCPFTGMVEFMLSAIEMMIAPFSPKHALPFSVFQSFFFLLMLPEWFDFEWLFFECDNPRLTVNSAQGKNWNVK